MDQKDYRRGAWALVFLYPLAAFLAFGSIQSGMWHDFRRDWPFVVAGPIGVVVWYVVATTWHSWPSFIGGYLLGAVVCAVVVAALEWVAEMLKRQMP